MSDPSGKMEAVTSRWDPDTLVQIITEALKARDFPAVEAALKVLAVTDPGRALDVHNTLLLGLDLAGADGH
jgi:hypothetical protein